MRAFKTTVLVLGIGLVNFVVASMFLFLNAAATPLGVGATSNLLMALVVVCVIFFCGCLRIVGIVEDQQEQARQYREGRYKETWRKHLDYGGWARRFISRYRVWELASYIFFTANSRSLTPFRRAYANR